MTDHQPPDGARWHFRGECSAVDEFPHHFEECPAPAVPVGVQDVEALIEASSLGTPEAKALRDSVPIEKAREVVARAAAMADAEPVGVQPEPAEEACGICGGSGHDGFSAECRAVPVVHPESAEEWEERVLAVDGAPARVAAIEAELRAVVHPEPGDRAEKWERLRATAEEAVRTGDWTRTVVMDAVPADRRAMYTDAIWPYGLEVGTRSDAATRAVALADVEVAAAVAAVRADTGAKVEALTKAQPGYTWRNGREFDRIQGWNDALAAARKAIQPDLED